MLFVLFLHVGIGSGLAIALLGRTDFRQLVDRVAASRGLHRSHARMVWLIGTIIAWPVGLFVFTTGRLVLASDDITQAATSSCKVTLSRAVPRFHTVSPAPRNRRHFPSV